MTPLPSRLRIVLGRIRRERIHLTVRGADGTAFGVLGSPHVAHHFSRLYCGAQEHRASGGLHLDDGSRFATAATRRHGLTVISEVSPPAALAADTLRIPEWVAVNAPIPADALEHEASLSRTARSNLGRVRRSGFTRETGTDRSWAPEFLARYHAVAIASRHGAEGYVDDLAAIERALASADAEFIRVMRGGACEAALLAHRDGEGYHLGRVGWRDGDPALVKDGALAAIYWFAFERARELGCTELRLGGTPPYVGSGVLLAKTHWGGRLNRAHSTFRERLLHLDPHHPHCRRLFANHAFIAFGPGNTFVGIGGMAVDDASLPASVTGQLSAWYRLRETPAPWMPCDDPVLPAGLRPWFERTPVVARTDAETAPVAARAGRRRRGVEAKAP